MSKISSNIINRPKEIIPIPPHHFISTRNLKIIQKNKESSRNKEKRDHYKKKFTYIPKYNYEPNHNDSNSNSNNFIDQKSITYNSITKENINNEKNLNYSNNTKKSDILSIFDEKKLLNNQEKIPNNNNLVLISTNSRKNSKGNILIYGKNKQILPQKYILNLNNNNSNNNNNILIGKISPENKGKIIRIGDKFKNIMNKEKGKIITIEDIYIGLCFLIVEGKEKLFINKLKELKNDIDINNQMMEGNTFLIISTREGNKNITKFLCENGCELNIQNFKGNTALHYAIANLFFEIVDILIAYGAREDIINNFGLRPWECIDNNLE